jgi:hypothetical protein
MLDKSFKAKIVTGEGKGAWSYVEWSGVAELFGTGRSVKVIAEINGHEFQVTLLPMGGGKHMLPLRESVMSAIEKKTGDEVEVHLKERV